MYKFFEGLSVTGVLLWAGWGIAIFIGWFLNIIAIVHAASGPFTTMLALRVVGIFVFILGGILGWIS